MIVKTKLLPDDLRKKLPLSLQIMNEFDTKFIRDKLLKSEIERWYNTNVLQNVLGANLLSEEGISLELNLNQKDANFINRTERILDFVPEKNKYNLSLIIEPVDFIILNIRNFLRIPRGSLIFDPDFGTNIYSYLKSLDITQIREMIYSELNEFISDLVSSYGSLQNISIKIKNVVVREIIDETGVGASYNVLVTLDMNSEEEVVLSNEFKL